MPTSVIISWTKSIATNAAQIMEQAIISKIRLFVFWSTMHLFLGESSFTVCIKIDNQINSAIRVSRRI
jgi:uncharacterized membrane protein